MPLLQRRTSQDPARLDDHTSMFNRGRWELELPMPAPYTVCSRVHLVSRPSAALEIFRTRHSGQTKVDSSFKTTPRNEPNWAIQLTKVTRRMRYQPPCQPGAQTLDRFVLALRNTLQAPTKPQTSTALGIIRTELTMSPKVPRLGCVGFRSIVYG